MTIRLCLASVVCAAWLLMGAGCANNDADVHYGYTGSRPAQCTACD